MITIHETNNFPSNILGCSNVFVFIFHYLDFAFPDGFSGLLPNFMVSVVTEQLHKHQYPPIRRESF